ncbi:MAG: GDSL-type esterase/lipase family protein [Lachnospiraceae bacterium]
MYKWLIMVDTLGMIRRNIVKEEMIMKFHKIMRYIIPSIFMLVMQLSFTAHAQEATSESIYYTALGDSIANGYQLDTSSKLIAYPQLITTDLELISNRQTILSSYAKNGLTTAKLNTTFLTQPEVIDSLQKADVITVTIGANDLMNKFKQVTREILGNRQHFKTVDEALLSLQTEVTKNPLLLVKVIGAIGSWDYNSFEEQWIQAMQTIANYRKTDAQLIVTTIYNPVNKMELPGTLNIVVENIIKKMNRIIEQSSEEYHYIAIDLFDSSIAEHTQSDGLHPNQEGQQLIQNLIEEQIDINSFESTKKESTVNKNTKEMQKPKPQVAKSNYKAWAGYIIFIINLLLLWLVIFLNRKKKNKN